MGSVTALAAFDPDEPGKSERGSRKRKAKRNVNGEGNIRLRGDGRYEGRAYVVTTDGREVRRSVYGKTWDAVHEKLTRMQADRMAGKRVASSSMTVEAYLGYWLDEHVAHRVRGSTFSSYRWIIGAYLVPLFGRRRLTALRPSDVRRGLVQLKQTCQCCARGKDQARADRAGAAGDTQRDKNGGARCCALTPPRCCGNYVSDGTVRYVHRVLRAALEDAVNEEELLGENVAKRLRIDHRYRPRFKAWTADEASEFLVGARGDRLYALFAVALSLGLRRGEALGLRWSDVDIENRSLTVEVTLGRVDGRLVLGPVKTDGSARVIPIPASLLEVLRQHRAAQQRERDEAGERWQENGYVFTTGRGTPIEPRNVNRAFDRLCESTGVRRIRFHDLRHSCASLLWSQGVPLEQIQDILGHGDPRTTKMIYVDVSQELQREAVDRLGFLFGDLDG